MVIDAGLSADELGPASVRNHAGAPIILEDGAWIGAGAIILPGVTVGTRAVVGAGSVVVKDVPAGSIVAGNPARVLRRAAV
jgi:acetyltransferase-like isoleucine patch superfamily enzyme